MREEEEVQSEDDEDGQKDRFLAITPARAVDSAKEEEHSVRQLSAELRQLNCQDSVKWLRWFVAGQGVVKLNRLSSRAWLRSRPAEMRRSRRSRQTSKVWSLGIAEEEAVREGSRCR